MSVGAKSSRELGPKGLAQENWGKSIVIPLYDPPLYDGKLLRTITLNPSPDRAITYIYHRDHNW